LEFLLNLIEELLQSERPLNDDLVIDSKSLGDSLQFAQYRHIILFRLRFGYGVRLGEKEHGQGQVNKAILKRLNVCVALYELVHLSADTTCDHSCGGCDGGNNLTCYHLSLLVSALADSVVSGSQVSSGMNKVNMEV
jgi:hypothetical protein